MSVPTRDSPRLSARGRRIRKDDGRWTAQVAGRKNRTIFTEEQHSALLAAYEADKYPTTIQKELLARQLGLAPIVVINWFQHRRQREPVKEKGGYVKNHPHVAEARVSVSPVANGDGSSIPSFHDYAGNGNTDTATPGADSANGSVQGPGSVPAIPPRVEPVIPVNGTKPTPYYGRMPSIPIIRPPVVNHNGDIVPKTANAHIGPMRWELDPLYIAPYIDHGFREALLPKDRSDNSSFALRPSSALLRK